MGRTARLPFERKEHSRTQLRRRLADRYLQPVVSHLHVRRQTRRHRRMQKIVRYVGEERSLRFKSLHGSQRLFHRRMRRMWIVPQRIQKQYIQPG